MGEAALLRRFPLMFMKKLIKKRVLPGFIAFIMLFSLLPSAAFAVGYTMNLTLNGIAKGNYDTVINDPITIDGEITGQTATTTYVKSIEENDSLQLTNTTGHFILSGHPSVSYLLDKTKPIRIYNQSYSLDNEYIANATVTAQQLEAAGLSSASFDPNCSKYYFLYFDLSSRGGSKFALLIQVKPASQKDTDKSALNASIAKVTDGNASNWYQSDDRYNGRDTSKDGFWSDLQVSLTAAQRVSADATVGQIDVDAAAADLKADIDNLIPKTQVNVTALYEALQKKPDSSADDYTADTWEVFTTVRDKAQTMLNSLFYQKGDNIPEGEAVGDATEINVASYQPTVDAAAASLCSAYNNLLYKSTESQLALWRKSAGWLLGKRDLTESRYTAKSWSAWQSAYHALQVAQEAGFDTQTKCDTYCDAVLKASSAYYGLESVQKSITVHARVADNFGAAYPKYAIKDTATATYDADIQLSDPTIGGLLDVMHYDDTPASPLPSLGQSGGDSWKQPCVMAYVNGELVVSRNGSLFDNWNGTVKGYNGYTTQSAQAQLHDGDEVVLVRALSPGYGYYIDTIPNSPYPCYYSYASLLEIQKKSDDLEVKAGAPLVLAVDKTLGAPESDSKTQPASGVSLFVSGVQATRAAAAAAPALTDTSAKTGGDGKAQTTFYAEGWYRLSAVNVTGQTLGTSSQGTGISGGAYPNLAGGDSVLVHVVPSTDSTSVRATLQNELDNVFSAHTQDYYGDQWKTVKAAYDTATDKISHSPLLGEAYTAQQKALKTVNEAIKTTEKVNSDALSPVKWCLNVLPSAEQVGKGEFTQYQKKLFEDLKVKYDALTAYQKTLLTVGQQAQYDALHKVYGKDGSSLPPTIHRTLTVKVASGDGTKYDLEYFNLAETGYLKSESKSIGVGDIGDGSTFSFVPGSEMDLTFAPGLTRTGRLMDYYISDIQVEGAGIVSQSRYSAADNHCQNFQNPDSSEEYRPITNFLELGSNENTWAMPNNDVTVTVTIRSLNAPPTQEETRANAKLALTATYNGYDKADYTTDGWAALTAAYNSGGSAISAAADENGISTALRDAKDAMAAVETRAVEQSGNEAEGTLGSVYVTVENSTSTKDDDGNTIPSQFTGQFVDATVPLNQDTTMMSAVLTALDENGYTWTGTGGATTNGTDITYLSSVTKHGYTLAEFTCGQQSGWMGTLNDWFVNESFTSFTASASNKSYRLVDGDQISVQYTTTGYGGDLGGSWGDANTSLKKLSCSGGTLSPAFAGGTLAYVLNIGASVTANVNIRPTAANKNYQVRTYLNTKTGDNWYRADQSIPVKVNDVINIGVGEYSWPSMNNQSDDKITYASTWYTVTVMDSSSAESVISLIDGLSSVIYSNYKAQSVKAAAARAAYNTLSSNAKAKVINLDKLTTAEDKIQFFTKIDNVKTLLNKIPAADKLTIVNKKDVQDAYNAWSKLNNNQKAYITIADVVKYEAAQKWLKAQGIDAGGTITGNDTVPGSSIIEPASSISGSTASASVSQKQIADAISAMKKNGESVLTIVPQDTGSAASIDVTIPKTAVQAVADVSGTALAVETPGGNVTIPNDTLLSVAQHAAGNDLKITVAKKAAADIPGSTVDLTNAVIAEVTMTSNNQAITTFNGKSIAIDLAVGSAYREGQGYRVIVRSSDGKVETKTGRCVRKNGSLYVEVQTTHLSTFIVTNQKVMPFSDVKEGAWYYDSIKYVYRNGLFAGTTSTTFSPDASMTRAMLVTVLYRMEGNPAVNGTNPFTDVADQKYYTNAVIWAAQQKIIYGTSATTFAPDTSVSRQQMAAILYRYAQVKEYDTMYKGIKIQEFDDYANISSYALTALNWAVHAKLIQGSHHALDPTGRATRAQVAVVLTRFAENVAK